MLTWWQGGLIVGDGRGSGVIYDEHCRPVKTVDAGNGYRMDLHEFTLTPPNVSWNGATAVARWEQLAGSSADDLEPVAGSAARDFEVTLRATTTEWLVAVRAFDARDRVLATTRPFRPRPATKP